MPKLSTPIQYESPLEILNELRPLELADKVKFNLDIPILNTNLSGIGRPANGKVACCTQGGALLKDEGLWANSEQRFVVPIYSAVPYTTFNFSVMVFGVIATYYSTTLVDWVKWYNMDNSIAYTTLVEDEYVFLPFVGKRLRILGSGSGSWGCSLQVRGYSK